MDQKWTRLKLPLIRNIHTKDKASYFLLQQTTDWGISTLYKIIPPPMTLIRGLYASYLWSYSAEVHISKR